MTDATKGIFWGEKKDIHFFASSATMFCRRSEAPSSMDATAVATSDNSWQYSQRLPLCSFLPHFSTPFRSNSTGSLMADYAQEILQRSVAREHKSGALLCARAYKRTFFYREQSH